MCFNETSCMLTVGQDAEMRRYEILADQISVILPHSVIDMTTKLIRGFGTIIRITFATQ